MRIIAFITHRADIRQILNHIGVDSEPPRITPARGPPLGEWADAQMRRWAMVSTLRQIGTRWPNRRRMMRSISAPVGKGWQQRFCQRCGAGLRPALLRGDAGRKASGSWCSATARSNPDQWPLGAPNRCHTSLGVVEFPIRSANLYSLL